MKPRIAVLVSGGLVTDVFAIDPECAGMGIMLVDFDIEGGDHPSIIEIDGVTGEEAAVQIWTAQPSEEYDWRAIADSANRDYNRE